MVKCQCENREHFEGGPGIHDFEGVPATRKVDTIHGKFNACNKCAGTHLKKFQETEEASGFFKGEAKL